MNMAVLPNGVTYNIPLSDMTFFKELAARMKWEIAAPCNIPYGMESDDVPNAVTLAAMKEVESGHDAGVVRTDSLESFMASMEE